MKSFIKENWLEIKIKLPGEWDKISNDDIENMKGNYEELEERLQKTYGYQKQEAKCHINEFLCRHGWRIKDDIEY